MAALLAKIAISLAMKLVTETFAARVLIEILRAWSKQTENKMDDRVVESMAQALGVDAEVLKEIAKP